MAFSLKIDAGTFAGRRYVFDQPQVSLGRTDENDVVVPDVGASRKHARIVLEGEAYKVEDLRSSNGTKVNGEPLTRPLGLRDGDLLQIGEVTFTFQAHVDAANSTRIVSSQELAQWGKSAKALAPTGSKTLVPGRAPRAAPAPPSAGAAVKKRFQELSKPLRMTVVGVGALFGLALIAALAQKIAGGGGAAGPAKTEDVYELTEKSDPTYYGQGPDVTFPASAHVVFSFNFSEPVPGKSLLTFHCQTDVVAKPEDVEVRLNGHHLGYLPATFGDSRPVDWILDRRTLLANAENRIDFVNLRHPATNWEVFALWMEQDSLPSGTPEALGLEAKQEFDLAEAKFGNDQVAAANLHDAWVHYKKARLILAAMPVAPEALQNLVTERLREVTNKLDHRCHQLIFTAQQALNTRGPDAALDAANEILNYFPTNDHPCFDKARKLVAKLE